MKKIIIPVIVIALFIMAAGCSEKFNVAAPYKDITVVYGFLDVTDTAHYIRIQKAFLDENKSALTMAQTPDSNFYASLDVTMKRFAYGSTTPHDSIQLNRVDLDLEGYPKQPGQFFNSPNYAYKFKNTLDPNYIYQLVIRNLATGKVDSAESPIIDDSNPTYFYIDALDTSQRIEMDFSATIGNKYFEFTGQYIPSNSNFSFEGLANPAVIGQTVVRFNWDDSDGTTGIHTSHSYDYNVGFFGLAGNGAIDVKVYNTSLYSALISALDPAPYNTYRLLNRCQLFIYLSTQDFLTYQQTSLTQGTGLTGTEVEPIFTNISGDNSVGLFTARGLRTGQITMTPVTVDSLEVNSQLTSAKIVGTVYH